MAGLAWYGYRLRAMTPAEIGARLRKKVREWTDARRDRDWAGVPLACAGAYPVLPRRETASPALREQLRREAADLLAGRWKVLGALELKVDDPPRWQYDYLAHADLATLKRGFGLNHRALPGGADIRLIWGLSRWGQLVRLAQAAWLLEEEGWAEKCVTWLEDWAKHNPPGRGWNWTSPLEAGLRLVQFTWLDALLADGAERWGYASELETLRYEILGPHAWYVWRHQSFGSSANNHLLGELTGLICATARWPALAQWGAPLETLHLRWEQEVLAQFAEDGGNREQALHYHGFAWELCWQARAALRAAGRPVATAVEERLTRAAGFLADAQVESDPWDYGDSDDGWVTPFCAAGEGTRAWLSWLRRSSPSSEIAYWWGTAPPLPPTASAAGPWRFYPESGLAIHRGEDWTLRWDVSPLGYLATAAHGHLDALHLSLWRRGVALVVDPGTGAYYSDPALRTHLASWDAHNGPHPADLDYPRRLGTFLWSEHHARPTWQALSETKARGELSLPVGVARREVSRLAAGRGWEVDDAFEPGPGRPPVEFIVCWQFAPGARVEAVGEREFKVARGEATLTVRVGAEWAKVELLEPGPGAEAGNPVDWGGACAPDFRQVLFGPRLRLSGVGYRSCVLRTAFLACAL